MTDLVQAVIATARRGRMRNTVVELVENRRIAWQNFGRHIWRYELQPLSAGDNSQVDRTLVRESFDCANNLCPPLLEIAGFPKRNEIAMTATLRMHRRNNSRMGPLLAGSRCRRDADAGPEC
jgi:hypothetical protein